VNVYVYGCIYVYEKVYIYAYEYVYTVHLYIHIQYIYVHIYVHIYVYMYISVSIYKCWNAGLSGIQSVCTGMRKLTMLEQVRYRTKPAQSGIIWVCYQTKILDARMPMPVLVCLVPMFSYADQKKDYVKYKMATS
jgi:hypothetical protein